SPTFLLIASDGKSYGLTSLRDVGAFGKSLGDVIKVSPSDYAFYAQSTATLRYFVKDSSGQMYVVTADGERFQASSAFIDRWNINSINFITLDDSTLAKIPLQTNEGKFSSYGSAIFYGIGGKRRPLSSYSAYKNLGGSAQNTFSASDDFINSTPLGPSYP
ncbi:MAG: hypothetical protein ACR2KZ_22760, partial [Segetibacter sp.]